MLLGVVGGFMTFDGCRAIVVGDFLIPRTGSYQGHLGPWSGVVERIGIPARSTPMKTVFVVLGILHLAAATALVASNSAPVGWLALAAAVTGLWYLPFGTVADTAVLAIVLLSSLNPVT